MTTATLLSREHRRPSTHHQAQYLAKEVGAAVAVAHNTQVKVTQSVHAEHRRTRRTGPADRSLSDQQPAVQGEVSVSGIAKIPEMEHRAQSVLDLRSGVVLRGPCPPQHATATSRAPSRRRSSARRSSSFDASLASTENLAPSDACIDTTFGIDRPRQLEQVARMVKARDTLEEERQAFFVELGGFDTHASELETVHDKFGQVNGALGSFVAELKAQGVWEQTTIVTASDFGRTLGSNGAGTDHAWGGHHIVMGGDVKGGQMLGQYPARLDEASDVNIGRNHRMLPTMPWEALWNAREWAGASSASVPTIIPTANFPEASCRDRSSCRLAGSDSWDQLSVCSTSTRVALSRTVLRHRGEGSRAHIAGCKTSEKCASVEMNEEEL